MSTLTPTGRKIRGDAKLACLNEEQQECLHHWLVEANYTYTQVADLVLANFGVSVSKSAVGMYYQRHIVRERYDDDVDAAAELAALPIGEFDAATIKHAKALAFSALTSPRPQIDTASRLLAIVHRVHKQQVVEKRLALEERRVALREALASRPPRKPRTGSPARGTHADDPSAPSPTPPPPSVPSSDSSLPPLDHTPTPDSSFPSLASVQSLSPTPPPPATSQKSPPNPPLFPASSSLDQPPPAHDPIPMVRPRSALGPSSANRRCSSHDASDPRPAYTSLGRHSTAPA